MSLGTSQGFRPIKILAACVCGFQWPWLAQVARFLGQNLDSIESQWLVLGWSWQVLLMPKHGHPRSDC